MRMCRSRRLLGKVRQNQRSHKDSDYSRGWYPRGSDIHEGARSCSVQESERSTADGHWACSITPAVQRNG